MPKHIHLYKSQKKSHGYIDGKVMPVFDNDNEDPNEKRTNSPMRKMEDRGNIVYKHVS